MMTTTMMNEEVDWENLLNFDGGADNIDFFDAALSPIHTTEEAPAAAAPPPAAAAESWLGELEELLMKDDDVNNNNNNDCGSFYIPECGFEVSDLLLDFPVEEESRPPSSEPEAEVVNEEVVGDKNSPASSASVGNEGGDNSEVGVNDKGNSTNFESNCENDKSSDEVNDDDDDDGGDDPLSKKRKRQLRNRDAAMRSRERKKIHVKELEMKSRYYEDECRKLKRWLDVVYNENQMLRLSLQTYGAPMTRPESAVLLLESLLLGSLVWFMVNMCLLPLSKLPLLSQEAKKLLNEDRELESVASRRKVTQISELWMTLSFTRSKRCRASRTKMKSHSAVLCF